MPVGDLGRRIPSDWEHVDKYPLRSLAPIAPANVEMILPTPSLTMRKYMDQVGGSCTGWSASWCDSYRHKTGRAMPRYDGEWLYRQAQLIDEYPDTPPAEGSSVRAAFDVLRTQGNVVVSRGKDKAPDPKQGVPANRWALTIDEIRAALATGTAVVFGINWWSNFDSPIQKNGERWIGEGSLGKIRGGHAICCVGASDKRQAVLWENSWGLPYPPVWISYATIEQLLREDGECCVPVNQ